MSAPAPCVLKTRYIPCHQLSFCNPFPHPSRSWSHISLDFITDLPPSHGCTTILTVVDHFFKMTGSTVQVSSDLADLLLTLVFQYYGVPEELISDCGPQITSKVFHSLCSSLNVTLSITLVRHPQSNGIADRTNHEVQKMLWLMCTSQHTEWSQYFLWGEYSGTP